MLKSPIITLANNVLMYIYTLLARIIFGKFVDEKQLADFILVI